MFLWQCDQVIYDKITSVLRPTIERPEQYAAEYDELEAEGRTEASMGPWGPGPLDKVLEEFLNQIAGRSWALNMWTNIVGMGLAAGWSLRKSQYVAMRIRKNIIRNWAPVQAPARLTGLTKILTGAVIASVVIAVAAVATELEDREEVKIYKQGRWVMRYLSWGYWADEIGLITDKCRIYGMCQQFYGIIGKRESGERWPQDWWGDRWYFGGSWIQQWWHAGFWETRIVKEMRGTYKGKLARFDQGGYVQAGLMPMDYTAAKYPAQFKRVDRWCEEPDYEVRYWGGDVDQAGALIRYP